MVTHLTVEQRRVNFQTVLTPTKIIRYEHHEPGALPSGSPRSSKLTLQTSAITRGTSVRAINV